ncbi:Slp family lipoprotein [Dokdonella sp.]|uniref:Slp family lipoprotein n=1 Tax=Dokdonella sp. TaxID=2291710 RepID=UPI003C51063F
MAWDTNRFSRSVIALALALSAGCAAPVFRDVANTLQIAPIDVQQSPDAYAGAEILWGGRIVSMEIAEGNTRMEVIAFPLNRAQQPAPDADSIGRFMLIVPGLANPLEYAPGRHLTTQGVITGIWSGIVDGREYPYPAIQASAVNIWPWGFMFDSQPRISIGIGVGTGAIYND